MSSPDSVLRPSPAVHVAELDGELVAFDERSRSLHAFDEIATLLWYCIDGTTAVADIVADVCEAFDAPEAAVAGDVRATFQEWFEKGLVERRSSDGSWESGGSDEAEAAGVDDQSRHVPEPRFLECPPSQ